MRPRIIYMGTPDFAVPALEQLAASDDADIALVVTQPDRAAGRGKKLVSPAVKSVANRLALPVLQTETLRHPEVRARIVDLKPDLVVVAAFGMILGKWILELPPHGCVNLHASLLPKYRGANPIASAIAKGEKVTGVTLMQMERGLDTGGIYAMAEVDITNDATTESLTPRLADSAGDLLISNLGSLLDGTLLPQPQPPGATLTRQMVKDDGWLDFATTSAIELERHVRAMWSWPRAWTTGTDGERIQVHMSAIDLEAAGKPGMVEHRGNDVLVATANGSLLLRRVQLPGGKPIERISIQQSTSLKEGAILGIHGGPEPRPPLVVPVGDSE